MTNETIITNGFAYNESKLVKALEENDKLKAEIERLSRVINALVKESDKQNSEIEQLSGELKEWINMYQEHISYYKAEIDEWTKKFNSASRIYARQKAEIEEWKAKAIMNTTTLERTVSKLQEAKIIELKAEIENLNEKNNGILEIYNKTKEMKNTYMSKYHDNFERNKKLKTQIEQLKAELEQSVKLPCKITDKVYIHRKDIGEILEGVIVGIDISLLLTHVEIRIKGDKRSTYIDIDSIGKVFFLTPEEAEQALKGGAE